MERRADVYGIGILEKGKQLARRSSGLAGRIGIGLLGLMLSNAALPGGGAPFGIAFAAAAPGPLTLPAAVGVALGYLLFFASVSSGTQWTYLFGILLALWIVWGGQMARTHPKREASRQEMIFRLTGAAFGVAAPALMVKVFTTLKVQDIFTLLSESVAAVGACWMFTRMLRPEKEKIETGAILMTAGLAAAALSHICIYEVSLGRVAAMLIILFAAGIPGGKDHTGSGTAIGVALGALVALCGVQKGFGYTLPGIWGLGGLLAGVFSPLGPGFLCAALLLGEMAAVFLFAQDSRAYVILLEALVASGLYLMIPIRVRSKLYIRFTPDAAGMGGAVGNLLLSRLHGAGEALSDIAKAADTVAKHLSQKEKEVRDTPEYIFRNTVQRLCRRCPNGAKCWAGSYQETLDGFGKLLTHLQNNGELTSDAVSGSFSQGCIRSEKLAAQAQRDYKAHFEHKDKKRQASRNRSMVTDQFEGLSMVLEGMEQQLRAIHTCDRELEEQIRECCLRNHLDIQQMNCCLDGAERLTLELSLPVGQWYRLENGRKLSLTALTAQLSASCLRALAPPQVHSETDMVRLVWYEMPRYRLKTGSAQLSAEEGKICGDICSAFPDRERREVMLISDGMGTGTHAAMDSAMTSGILSRLLKAGIGPDAALRLVNAALLVRTGEESLATVDLAQVDLYSGQAYFFKAGAAPTYLRRSGHSGSVEASSLPAGILQDVAFERASVTLRTGDMIVMVSDGAVQGDGSWILHELEQAGMQEPQQLAEHLAKCARAHAEGGRPDDITVLVGQLIDA